MSLLVLTLLITMLLAGLGQAQEITAGEQETTTSLKVTDTPASLSLLTDWSKWLVGIQSGALGLITFIAGKEGWLKFTNGLARWLVYFAVAFFAFSTVFATIVLGQIPVIRQRVSETWLEGGPSDRKATFMRHPLGTMPRECFLRLSFGTLPLPSIGCSFSASYFSGSLWPSKR